MLKRTILHPAHQKLGARLVEFGGWEMPVQYTGILDEHQAVRTRGGLFDIAHMGEIEVKGANAARFLQAILTNDVAKLSPGQGQYTLMCNETGGVVDDLYLYRLASDTFLLMVNASRIEEDRGWLLARAPSSEAVHVEDLSDRWGAVALQGPNVRSWIDRVLTGAAGRTVSMLAKNEITPCRHAGQSLWAACTGYTGEDGFELIGPLEVLPPLWDAILELGAAHGLKPCGLGARDTLRLESCYPLYGHELSESISPIEAGLGFFVVWEKGDFVGAPVLARHKSEGPPRRSVAFKMTGASAPPRAGYAIWAGGVRVGETTSGSLSPTLGVGIGLGLVSASSALVGAAIEIEIRARRFPAVVVKKPFYRKAV